MLWNSWAKSWGSAWAESWGPLEEQPGDQQGGALLRSAQERTRQVIDAVARESKAKQRLEEERRRALEQAQEALEAPDSVPVESRARLPDSVALVAPETVEEVARIDPLAPVNSLLINAQISSVATVKESLIVANDQRFNDDDEAMALIMILAELE